MLGLLLSCALQGAAPVLEAAPPPPPSALWDEVAETVRAGALPQAPAVSFAIRDGAEVRAWAWGVLREPRAEGEDGAPATVRSRFRIASISKPLTAIAAALLWQREKLDLDADVRLLVPEFPEKRWPVTARQLAAHLGGVRHYDRKPFTAKTFGDVVDSLQAFSASPLVAEPGTRYHYSTFGFNLLGAVVQRAARRDFRAFVAEEVCAPLGMTDTGVEEFGAELGEVAALYETLPQLGRTEVPRDDIGYKWPGGGFLSTASDLVRMTAAVCDDRLLGAEARALMCASARTAGGEEVGYSFGWSVGRDAAGRLRLAHSGSQLGAKSFLLVYPEQDLALALIVNHGDADIGNGRLVRRAAARLLEQRAAAAD